MLRKKLLKKNYVQKIFSFLIALYLLLVRYTCRWTYKGQEHILPYWQSKHPIIVVFWHNRMAMAPFAWRSKNPFFMLISQHSDGLIIAQVVRHFGIQCIAGSSSHGNGFKGLRGILRCLKKGHCVGITPDGPRGPCQVVKEGIFMASYLSQCPVIALSFATTRHRRLSSWDRFFVPLPFGRGMFAWSCPVMPPSQAEDKMVFMEKVSQALTHVRLQTDQ
jgi:lysophospholipid acyltransferase (LPLAT)-like uncharacterized protein